MRYSLSRATIEAVLVGCDGFSPPAVRGSEVVKRSALPPRFAGTFALGIDGLQKVAD